MQDQKLTFLKSDFGKTGFEKIDAEKNNESRTSGRLKMNLRINDLGIIHQRLI